MNMTVTESDKKLLSFLAAFVLAVLFFIFIFRPLSAKESELKKEINELKQQESSMDAAAAQAKDMSETEEDTREQMAEVLMRLYPMLQSQEAENMMTILMLNHSLQIRSLTITMPENPSNLNWYQYSEGLQADTSAEAETESSVTSEESGFGVYTARITCTAEGDNEDILALVDDISYNYPAISILSAEWSTTETQTTVEAADDEEETEAAVSVVKTGNLTITVEIFMCEQ